MIAIDGPSGAGKGTVARKVAETLGYRHVDTGAMYRAVAWAAVDRGIALDDEAAVAALADRARIEIDATRVAIDGADVTTAIRTPVVDGAASRVARLATVRAILVAQQRAMAGDGNLVMEGRDIGTNVFPETDYKFYLDAHIEERTKRRAAEGVNENLAARDQRDSQRAAAPLMIALGARVINNSAMTSAQTSELIINDIKARLAQSKQLKTPV